MEIALQLIISTIAAIGLAFILADVFKIPKYPVSKAITSLGKRKNKKTNPLDIWLGDLANLIASKLRLNEYKRLQLKIDLDSADMSMSPEQYVANAIVKALFIGVFAIPFLFFAPIISALVAVIAVVIYFSEYKKVGNIIKEKRRQIEAELPRLVSNIDKTLAHSRDVLGILDSYREHAGEELRRELDITVADMRSGNGVDKADIEDTSQPVTVTLLVNAEQAEVLAYYEMHGDMHIVLEYRGDAETAQKYLDAQNKVFGGN